MSDAELITLVRKRVDSDAHQPSPIVSEDAWRETEAAIGFCLPPLLFTLFRNVGNGGFGPGYGLRGALGGARDDNGWDLVNYYRLWFDEPLDHPSWTWPLG